MTAINHCRPKFGFLRLNALASLKKSSQMKTIWNESNANSSETLALTWQFCPFHFGEVNSFKDSIRPLLSRLSFFPVLCGTTSINLNGKYRWNVIESQWVWLNRWFEMIVRGQMFSWIFVTSTSCGVWEAFNCTYRWIWCWSWPEVEYLKKFQLQIDSDVFQLKIVTWTLILFVYQKFSYPLTHSISSVLCRSSKLYCNISHSTLNVSLKRHQTVPTSYYSAISQEFN